MDVRENETRLCETHQFKAIFPKSLNANETLFGGQALEWMDEVAYITATRFTRQKMFTIKADNIEFIRPITPHSIIELIGFLEKIEKVRLTIKVEVFVEEMYRQGRHKAMQAAFTFATLNENHRPKRIDYTLLEQADDQFTQNEGKN